MTPEGARRISPARSSKAPSSAIRFSIAIPSASWAITSRSSKAPARSTPLPATARRTSRSASKYGLPVYCPVDRRRKVLSRRRRGRPPSRRTHRQDGLAGEPDRHRNSEIARRAARRREDRAQLSALLALPQLHHLPRHRTMVRRHGAQRSARPHAQSHQEREVDAGVGRGAHLQHDRHAARLVHLAPARLGRADHRVLLRKLPGAADRSQDSGSRGRAFRPAHRRRLVSIARPPNWLAPKSPARAAADTNSAKRPTFSTSGSIPAPVILPC